jgi:hypothetical protein
MNGILITTTTCPKCPALKAWVADNVKFDVLIVDEMHPEFTDLLQKYNVTAAPTFLIEENGEEVFHGNDDYEIEDFLKTQ